LRDVVEEQHTLRHELLARTADATSLGAENEALRNVAVSASAGLVTVRRPDFDIEGARREIEVCAAFVGCPGPIRPGPIRLARLVCGSGVLLRRSMRVCTPLTPTASVVFATCPSAPCFSISTRSARTRSARR